MKNLAECGNEEAGGDKKNLNNKNVVSSFFKTKVFLNPIFF